MPTTEPTEMESAHAALDAAKLRVLDVMRRSTRALCAGGFRFVESTDPLRNQVLDEIEKDAGPTSET